jgi:hypothetical protein
MKSRTYLNVGPLHTAQPGEFFDRTVSDYFTEHELGGAAPAAPGLQLAVLPAPDKTLGQIAYEAFVEVRDSEFSFKPEWQYQTSVERAAWEAAVKAVAQYLDDRRLLTTDWNPLHPMHAQQKEDPLSDPLA